MRGKDGEGREEKEEEGINQKERTSNRIASAFTRGIRKE